MSAAVAAVAPLLRSDRLLWLAVGLLAPLGMVMVASASVEGVGAGPSSALTAAAARHGMFAVLGVAAMVVTARIDYRALRRFALPAYLLTGALLVVVVAAGSSEYGARRWLPVGGATLQPSEGAKLALVLVVALYASARPPKLGPLLVTLALLAPVAGLVLLQPDTGTVAVLGAAWLGLVFAWGVPLRLLGGVLGLGLALGPLAFAIAVPDYQRERLAVFLDPGRDPLGSGFNLRQAEAAMASGGLSGEGLFRGAESHLAGVAARSSDFVFSLVGEELGLAGALAVVALFALVAWRGFEAARHAPDRFGQLLAAGLTTLLLSQATLNVAVNLRLFPATGLPLPFISQGGSSLLMAFIAVGLIQSVYSQRLPRGARVGGTWGDEEPP